MKELELIETRLPFPLEKGVAFKLEPGNYVIFVDSKSFDADAFLDGHFPEEWGKVDAQIFPVWVPDHKNVSDVVKAYKIEEKK